MKTFPWIRPNWPAPPPVDFIRLYLYRVIVDIITFNCSSAVAPGAMRVSSAVTVSPASSPKGARLNMPMPLLTERSLPSDGLFTIAALLSPGNRASNVVEPPPSKFKA